MSAFQPALLAQQTPDQIRSRPRPVCYLCGAPGVPLYEGVEDRLFGAPGVWNFKLCPTSSCGLMWLDPIPEEEEIGKAYANYYTHAGSAGETGFSNNFQKSVSRVLAFVNPVRHERERLSLMYLDDSKPGMLLDVGCGNGARLARLQARGWNVVGTDVDPQAVAYAREVFKLDVRLGQLESANFEAMYFDCILLHHVIEHLHDPVKLLRECRRLLRTGGQLVIVTPNSESFAHKHFGASWRGLEPPRHIHIFSPLTLSAAATKAGLAVCRSWTTVANATTFWRGSTALGNGGQNSSSLAGEFFVRVRALGYLYRSIFKQLRNSKSGEECVLLATR